MRLWPGSVLLEVTALIDEQPVSITIQPWMLDHRFEGSAVLPAVDMMQYMARAVQASFSESPVTCMQHASFDRFLRIDPSCPVIEALCSVVIDSDGVVRVTLAVVSKVGSAAVTRIKEHATVFFADMPPSSVEVPEKALAALHIPGFDISAKRLYEELVPFGPAFQSVQEKVTITESAAVAQVLALKHYGALEPLLGSSFPFDGSLHAACAWAQRYCGIVAFPVGFDERLIVQPISPGETVCCVVIPVSVHKGVIRFDIWLYDQNRVLREVVTGLAMRDVSGGRLLPPAWVRSDVFVLPV